MSDHHNRLIGEKSLYLRQHAHNPVDWYPWSEEALEKARREDKLILLSIGYSSCHWCHVMERESFENGQVAEFLNQHFVCIKVDREERPDIDAIYMEAVQMMTGQGGWPLNVWLTPDLKPVYGGTYFPPDTSHNRPGFLQILMRLQEIREKDPKMVAERADELAGALRQELYDQIQPAGIRLITLEAAKDNCAGNYDADHGGFSSAPKFPSAMAIEFLLRYSKLTGDNDACDMALNSLRKMCLGGIYDQIGGGFHRYSTDRTWLVPHFEKMLYDNALLLSALTDAWQVSADTLFRDTISETTGFIRREMTSPSGAFYSALDADSEGEEGTFYVWSWKELSHLISEEDFPVFSAYFDVFPEGNWEGKVILNRSHSSLDFSILSQSNHDEFKLKVTKWKELLLAMREERERPAMDEKIILSWNSMMLKALCKCWLAFPSDDLLDLIRMNAGYLVRTHVIENDSNPTDAAGGSSSDTSNTFTRAIPDLMRVSYDQASFAEYSKSRSGLEGHSGNPDSANVHIPAFCDDFALFAEALSYVFQVTGEDRWLKLAIRLCNRMNELFYDSGKKSFNFTRENQPDVLVRKKDAFDNATPSANSAAAAALLRIGRLSGESGFVEQSAGIAESLGSVIGSHALAFGYLLQVSSEHLSNRKGEIVITGQKRQIFADTVARKYLPFHLVIVMESPENSGFEGYSGKSGGKNQSLVYICQDFACEKPVSTVEELVGRLKIEPQNP